MSGILEGYLKYLRHIRIVVVLITVSSLSSVAYESDEKSGGGEKSKPFVVIINDGKVSVEATNINLSVIAKAIGEKIVPPFTVESFAERNVTVSFSELPLRAAISRLVQRNYTLVVDPHTNQLKKMFILHEGSGTNVIALNSKAMEDFRTIARTSPDRDVRVKANFIKAVPLDDLHAALQKTNILVVSFQHQTSFESGGYILREGETMEEAVKNYRNDHRLFVEKRLEHMKEMLEASQDNDIREAMSGSIHNALRTKEEFNKRDLQIVSAGLSGRAADIERFEQDTLFIFDIELDDKRSR